MDEMASPEFDEHTSSDLKLNSRLSPSWCLCCCVLLLEPRGSPRNGVDPAPQEGRNNTAWRTGRIEEAAGGYPY